MTITFNSPNGEKIRIEASNSDLMEDSNMDGQSELEIKKKAIALVMLIQDMICVNPRSVGKKKLTCKFDAGIFKQKMEEVFGKLTETTWVKILKFLREKEKFRSYYLHALRVPFEHDGGSSMHFPEVYAGNGKVLVETMVDINNLTFFYSKENFPGIERRSWKKGEMVYVPKEKANRFVDIEWIKIV